MKKILLSTAVLASCLVMGSCAGNSSKKAAETTTKAFNLNGEWTIVSVNGTAVTDDAEMGMPSIGFETAEKRVYGFAGCNRFFGEMVSNEADPKSISFDKMGSTKVMCHRDSLETVIFEALDKVSTVEAVGCCDEETECAGMFNQEGVELMKIQKKAAVEAPAENN